jgi:hypothetical protein
MSASIAAGRFLASMLFLALLISANAWGQAHVDQTLDQVNVFDAKVVLKMAFDDPNATADFANLGIPQVPGSDLASCKLASKGLYCLYTSGGVQVVRYWKDTLKPLDFVDLFRCDDTTLGLAGSRQCTGLTVDLFGAAWVAGRRLADDTTYSLIKVVEKPSAAGTCPISGGVTLVSNPLLCAKEFATGAGVLSDLNSIDGEVAAAFNTYGSGIIAIRDGSSTLYFNLVNPGLAPIFSTSPLSGGARLHSTALLQVPGVNASDPVSNFVLATTNTGKVLATGLISGTPTSLTFNEDGPVFNIDPGASSITVDATSWRAGSCPGNGSCTASGATLTASGGNLEEKTLGSAIGLGVSGGPSGGEIDIGQTLNVSFPEPHAVTAIQILFLFNGPEFDDKDETAQVTTSQGAYTLSVRNSPDDATADWTGPGVVTKCGTTLGDGTGCFLITNPFPSPVSSMAFTALPGGGTGSNESDFSIGRIETAYYGIRTSATSGRAYLSNRDASAVMALQPQPKSSAFTQLVPVTYTPPEGPPLPLTLSTSPYHPDGITVAPGSSLDLATCTSNCAPIKDQNGEALLTLSNVTLAPASPSGARIFQVKNLPDCRYAAQVPEVWEVCATVLNLNSTLTGNARIEALINYLPRPVIVPLEPNGPNRYSPAAQLLNVTPLLPEDVTSQFDSSGVAPKGLPPLYISRQYRGQLQNDHLFDAFFYKVAEGVTFLNTVESEVDVLGLTGKELGCLPTPNLLDWDVLTRVSETYKSVGNIYIDSIGNVGCGTLKGKGPGLSLVPYNLEIAPDTYGPTIKSFASRVTIRNDAVFARLAQSLWDDVGTSRRDFACKQVDKLPGAPPLSATDCNKLAGIWSLAKLKLDLCVASAFGPRNFVGTGFCDLARKFVVDYKGALPAAAAGQDVANRLGEQKARVDTFLHVFDTRFRPSIKSTGYCREWGTCPP